MPEMPHFFLVGVQRSGTELLRMLLNSHSQVAVPAEATFLMPYLRRHLLFNDNPLSDGERQKLVRYLLGNSQYQGWGMPATTLDPILHQSLTLKQAIIHLYRQFAQQQNKKICGDKTPSFIRKLPLLLQLYPQARFVHLVRDGRDVALSLQKYGHVTGGSLPASALTWRVKLWLIERAFRRMPARTLTIRYEDLLQNPTQTLEQTCTFLGLPYEPAMLNFWQRSDQFLVHEHSQLIRQPINPANVGLWQKEMSLIDQRAFTYLAGDWLTKFGYGGTPSKLNWREKVRVWGALATHLPRRLYRTFIIASYMRLAARLGWQVETRYYD